MQDVATHASTLSNQREREVRKLLQEHVGRISDGHWNSYPLLLAQKYGPAIPTAYCRTTGIPRAQANITEPSFQAVSLTRTSREAISVPTPNPHLSSPMSILYRIPAKMNCSLEASGTAIRSMYSGSRYLIKSSTKMWPDENCCRRVGLCLSECMRTW